GTGYTSVPEISVTTGQSGVFLATIVPNVVSSIMVIDGGSGYTGIPAVAIEGNATATATLADVVDEITVTNAGSGYTALSVAIGTGQEPGTDATATATVVGGAVTAVAVTNGGTGYTTAPTVTITGSGEGGARDILADYVEAAFGRAGYNRPLVSADSRDYHPSGSVHCGTNVIRSIPSYKWWVK
ncbi:MAG: hypothetical protein GY794_25285, partial [bacterium]|nr:hypothetical protein [bacterium]